MGNTFTSGNSIYVQTDKPVYVAGDRVSGNIYLNIQSPFDSKGVFLTLNGFERCEWDEEKRVPVGGQNQALNRHHHKPHGHGHHGHKHGHNNHGHNHAGGGGGQQYETIIEVHRARRNIIRQRMCVYPMRARLMPGQYTFPFQFDLSAGLPGNFEESGRSQFFLAGMLKICFHLLDLMPGAGTQGSLLKCITSSLPSVMPLPCSSSVRPIHSSTHPVRQFSLQTTTMKPNQPS